MSKKSCSLLSWKLDIIAMYYNIFQKIKVIGTNPDQYGYSDISVSSHPIEDTPWIQVVTFIHSLFFI